MATPASELTGILARHSAALEIVTAVTEAHGELEASLRSVTSGHSGVALFVDPNLITTAYVTQALESISTGVVSGVFTDIHENPCEADVLAAAAFLAPLNADCVVALGGGVCAGRRHRLATRAAHDGRGHGGRLLWGALVQAPARGMGARRGGRDRPADECGVFQPFGLS